MKRGLAAILCLLVSCFWSTGHAAGLEEEVAFASESYAAVASDDLGEERAREGVDDLAFARGALKATMHGNTSYTSNITTYNSIDGSSFTDASGIISVIQNTGNNVIIQNLTDVNVTINP
jgi:phosphopantetheine adenylyltransferase